MQCNAGLTSVFCYCLHCQNFIEIFWSPFFVVIYVLYRSSQKLWFSKIYISVFCDFLDLEYYGEFSIFSRWNTHFLSYKLISTQQFTSIINSCADILVNIWMKIWFSSMDCQSMLTPSVTLDILGIYFEILYSFTLGLVWY